MNQEIYQILSLAARYWFVFLLFVIVLRGFVWLRRDVRAWKRYQKSVPSAGVVGEAVVIFGNEALPQATKIEVLREGILGKHKVCDICLPSEKIKKRSLYFRLDEGKGLYISLLQNNYVALNNFVVDKKSNAAYVVNGSVLQVEDILLKFYFYTGYGIPTLSNEDMRFVEQQAIQTFVAGNSYAGLNAQVVLQQDPKELPYQSQFEEGEYGN